MWHFFLFPEAASASVGAPFCCSLRTAWPQTRHISRHIYWTFATACLVNAPNRQHRFDFPHPVATVMPAPPLVAMSVVE